VLADPVDALPEARALCAVAVDLLIFWFYGLLRKRFVQVRLSHWGPST